MTRPQLCRADSFAMYCLAAHSTLPDHSDLGRILPEEVSSGARLALDAQHWMHRVPLTILAEIGKELVLYGFVPQLSPPLVRPDSLLRHIGKQTMDAVPGTFVRFLSRPLRAPILSLTGACRVHAASVR